jgi:hypothetical protein
MDCSFSLFALKKTFYKVTIVYFAPVTKICVFLLKIGCMINFFLYFYAF